MSQMMPLLIVLCGVVLLLLLITVAKLNAFISFIIVCLFVGLTMGLSVDEAINAVKKGIGDTLGLLALILGFGAMLGRIIADSGAAQRITRSMIAGFGLRRIHWALMLTGFIVGIPMFYAVGFVILIPIVFTVAAACVLIATLYPLALDALSGAKITVGAPYFNAVMMPIFLVVLLLMAVAPLVPWRKANPERLKSRLLVPAALGLVAGVVMLFATWPLHWTGPVAAALIAFVIGTIFTDFARAVNQRRVQHPGEPLPRSLARVVLGNRRHYGGMIVHLGIVVIAIGLTGSGLFRLEKSVVMSPGEVVEVGRERLRFDGVRSFQRENYFTVQGFSIGDFQLIQIWGAYWS